MQLLHHSGGTTPSAMTSSTGVVLLVWLSDNSNINSCWSASWGCSLSYDNPPVKYLSSAGTISHGSYENNEYMQAIIVPSGATSMTLSFSCLDFEAGYDYLDI